MSSSPQVVVVASSFPEKASTKHAERSTRSGFPKFLPPLPVKSGSNIEAPITPISPLSARSEFSKDEYPRKDRDEQWPRRESPRGFGGSYPTERCTYLPVNVHRRTYLYNASPAARALTPTSSLYGFSIVKRVKDNPKEHTVHFGVKPSVNNVKTLLL
jgi:hypothetical protein